MSLTPEQRKLRARKASFTSWANTADPSARTAPARAAAQAALRSKLERQVDPDGTMDPAELARRVEYARKAHQAGMTLKSSQARARGKAEQAPDAPPPLAPKPGAVDGPTDANQRTDGPA